MSIFFNTIMRIARIQRQSADRLAIQQAVAEASALPEGPAQLEHVIEQLHLNNITWVDSNTIDQTMTPALIFHPETGWAILRAQNALGQWIVQRQDAQTNDWVEETPETLTEYSIARVSLVKPLDIKTSKVFRVVLDAVLHEKSRLKEVIVGGILINIVALATSLYSMQVYDRVVPTGAQQTLFALTLGVFLAIGLELVVKFLRSFINERLGDNIDRHLSKIVYSRFLGVRLDQLPASVGSLAAQLKGYETIRNFLVTIPSQLLVDLPFIFVFTLVLWFVGGNLALIPLSFALVSVLIGITYRRKVERLTREATEANNLKTGLLVETVEGAETIKAGQGGWRMLSRWLNTTDEARVYDLDMRKISEHSQFLITSLHQVSYILIVALGALKVSGGDLSMGGLIACSILSGRVLNPSSKIPGMLVQWGHVKAALQGLDKMWSLEDDHHGVEQPILVDNIKGQYKFEDVLVNYDERTALNIKDLKIRPGEKIGIIGPVGAGKSTLLKLLSGLFKPTSGRVMLDGVDLSHISKPIIAEKIGYIQQDGRLFSGTLRENLILGLVDPGDDVILQAAEITGLHQALVSRHPMGLECPIAEGGTGLSGGQKQLVNLTKVFLRQPKVWLLDEPTASIDRTFELKVTHALKRHIKTDDTLVLITHKPEMLSLVDRVIVVVDQKIMLDGPKEPVLQKLQEKTQQAQSAAAAGATS
ncbi:MAG: ATP-binding cassette domain-containing protein [Glaciecola sp.]|jgi:ATP-binding cassette subfamily C protein LapB